MANLHRRRRLGLNSTQISELIWVVFLNSVKNDHLRFILYVERGVTFTFWPA